MSWQTRVIIAAFLAMNAVSMRWSLRTFREEGPRQSQRFFAGDRRSCQHRGLPTICE